MTAIGELDFSSNKLGGIAHKIRSLGTIDIHSAIKTEQSSTHLDQIASNLLEEENSVFTTLDNPNSWVLFHFPNRKLLLTAYSFKVIHGANQNFPRKWTVKGSHNNISWFHIDSQETNIFIDYSQVETFECDNPGSFSFIKITQTGLNSQDSNVFRFNQIEFFGVLYPESDDFKFITRCSSNTEFFNFITMFLITYAITSSY